MLTDHDELGEDTGTGKETTVNGGLFGKAFIKIRRAGLRGRNCETYNNSSWPVQCRCGSHFNVLAHDQHVSELGQIIPEIQTVQMTFSVKLKPHKLV